MSRAAKTLLQSPLVPWTPAAIDSARKRLPYGGDVLLPRPPDHPPNTIPDATFRKHVRKAVANGGCASISKWTGEILDTLLNDEGILHSCLVICEAISNNRLPEVSRALNLQKVLLAFKRADGKSDRLIGVGEIFYRATSGFIMELVRPALRSILESQGQFGCGAKGGAELAHHTIQSSLETFGPNSAVVILDEKDAFPNADRARMLQQCFNYPDLQPMWGTASFAYGSTHATMVMMRNGATAGTITSSTGTIIGDSLGSALYCLYAQPTINEINEGLDVQQASVCDDSTTVCRHWKDAITIIERAIAHPNKNLNMRPDKTCILWPRRTQPPQQLIDACKTHNIGLKLRHTKILGGVIGCSDNAVTQHVDSVVNSYSPLLEAITNPHMPKQIAALILRVCANTRINYQLRMHPPQLTTIPANKFDAEIQTAFMHIHGLTDIDLHDENETNNFLKQCELDLPIRAGGLGLRKATGYAVTAYLAAAVSAGQKHPDRYHSDTDQDTNDLPPFLRRLHGCWRNLTENGIETMEAIPFDENDQPSRKAIVPQHPKDLIAFYEVALETENYKLQRILTRGLVMLREQRRSENSDARANMRWATSSAKGAAAWLQATPESPHTTFSNAEWEQAVKFHMGLTPSKNLRECVCERYTFPGDDNTHFQSCLQLRRRAVTYRHDGISRTITRLCINAGISAITEVTSMHDDGNRLRPDGLQFFPGADPSLTDTTVRHPCTTTNINLKRRPNAILKTATREKNNKYRQVAAREQSSFTALAALSYGPTFR